MDVRESGQTNQGTFTDTQLANEAHRRYPGMSRERSERASASRGTAESLSLCRVGEAGQVRSDRARKPQAPHEWSLRWNIEPWCAPL
eukprot:2766226-Pyramimonas_sp.AAC.1